MNSSEKFSFIDIIYNSSYRKVIDIQNEKNYNSFEINLLDNEEDMTELLLKNKKLLNAELIIDYSYNNEELTVNKTSDIFDYYLKLIFIEIKNEIIKYQEKQE